MIRTQPLGDRGDRDIGIQPDFDLIATRCDQRPRVRPQPWGGELRDSQGGNYVTDNPSNLGKYVTADSGLASTATPRRPCSLELPLQMRSTSPACQTNPRSAGKGSTVKRLRHSRGLSRRRRSGTAVEGDCRGHLRSAGASERPASPTARFWCGHRRGTWITTVLKGEVQRRFRGHSATYPERP